jgi:sugar O-acyltransferase (sialic acid O-acetyltransferase NeuD family)
MIGPREFILIGAGGHAKVIAAAIVANGDRVLAVFDDDANRHGQTLLGAPIVGPVAAAAEHAAGALAVLAIGSNAARARLAMQLDLRWGVVVHPRAWVHETVQLGPGAVVFAGAVVQPDALIGAHSIVNTGASIDHDCLLGRAVHIAPGVHLAGGVRVGDESFLGVGAAAIPYVTIGDRVIVGAGAVVTRDLHGDTTAVGVPARVIRSAIDTPRAKTGADAGE